MFVRAILALTSSQAVCRGDLRFITYGDWGQSGNDLNEVASCARKYAGTRDFSILLGDNFYPGGVTSVKDPQFDLFREVIAAGANIPHYLVLGNMDYLRNVQAQIDYSKIDSRWHMPSRYHQETFTKGDALICAYFLDTEYLDSTQLGWLDAAMSADKCTGGNGWRIVSGHYPIWSASGSGDVPKMKQQLLPILKKHNVSLYLSGHHHLHEVFFDGQLVEIVSGATSFLFEPLTFKPHDLMIWGVSGKDINGYTDISVSRNAIKVNIVSAKNGQSFQSFTITSGGTKQSIFGHISWSNANSNADASKARLPAMPLPSAGGVSSHGSVPVPPKRTPVDTNKAIPDNKPGDSSKASPVKKASGIKVDGTVDTQDNIPGAPVETPADDTSKQKALDPAPDRAKSSEVDETTTTTKATMIICNHSVTAFIILLATIWTIIC